MDTRNTSIFSSKKPFKLLQGGVLEELELAYEMYGKLNSNKDNAILLFHALTGDQHASNFTEREFIPKLEEGWWNPYIGKDKSLNTDKFCIICINYLGGSSGSSSPLTINPKTGELYGKEFPSVTYRDIVLSQKILLDSLGVKRLKAVVGASIGGLLSLLYALYFPEEVESVISIASGMGVSTLQRIHNFEQIYAIEMDPGFHGGDYLKKGTKPERGLALARMISHKTFISLRAMKRRAKREIINVPDHLEYYKLTHPEESYMVYQGNAFTERFDANSYLRILYCWQVFDLIKETGEEDLDKLFKRTNSQKYLIFSIDSDVCFYPEQQEELEQYLQSANTYCRRITVHSQKGHDSFLVEPNLYAPYIKHALEDNFI